MPGVCTTVLACLQLMVEDPATLVEMDNLNTKLKSQLLTAVFKVSMGAAPTVVDRPGAEDH